MYFSAAWSSSAVDTPSRILPAMSFMVRAWMAPAAAIFSISAGDFLMITATRLELVFEPQRRDRRPDVGVDLPGRARLDRLRRVVVALDELGAGLVADALVLGRVEVDVVGVPVLGARAATRE